jgi:hypothetical protein
MHIHTQYTNILRKNVFKIQKKISHHAHNAYGNFIYFTKKNFFC